MGGHKPDKRKKDVGPLPNDSSKSNPKPGKRARVIQICGKYNEDFERIKPAQLYCSNCRSTKPVSTEMTSEKELSSENEGDVSYDVMQTEIADLKKTVLSKDETIKQKGN